MLTTTVSQTLVSSSSIRTRKGEASLISQWHSKTHHAAQDTNSGLYRRSFRRERDRIMAMLCSPQGASGIF